MLRVRKCLNIFSPRAYGFILLKKQKKKIKYFTENLVVHLTVNLFFRFLQVESDPTVFHNHSNLQWASRDLSIQVS